MFSQHMRNLEEKGKVVNLLPVRFFERSSFSAVLSILSINSSLVSILTIA